jgi:hypothetical protein
MAEVLIQNLRNPSQIIAVVVTLRRMRVAESHTDKLMWLLEASVDETDANGDLILPVRRWISNSTTLTEDVNELITELSEKVDWDYVVDTDPPSVSGHWPGVDEMEVDVTTTIRVNLEEIAPSSGIDLDSIQIFVKGFDLTNQMAVTGDLRSCSVEVTPGTKFMSAVP